ncbi:MAG TPA: hypothetical protein PK225_03450 [Azonexus sp.]|jgi:hypothetical protein|nr:hypothetical protein [Azonexus sp.]
MRAVGGIQWREQQKNDEQLACAQGEIPPSAAKLVFSGLQNAFLVNDQVRGSGEATWSLALPSI